MFVVSRNGGNLAQINGQMYKRTKGRMYRSYFMCIEPECKAEVIINDLKGGFIRVVSEHGQNCKHVSQKQVKYI